jgi:lipoprotein-anchoring transpeptidase ErfK/SrfK
MSEVLELPDSLSRRGFLKLSSLSMLALGLPVRWNKPAFGLDKPALGRVVDPTLDVYRVPSFSGDRMKSFWQDDLLDLAGAAIGDTYPLHNRVWYEIDGLGFAHSSSIQPVRDEPNEPVTYVPYAGLLTDITVPFVDAYWEPTKSSRFAYRFYYDTTHWINGVSRDAEGRLWYRIYDDKFTHSYYARAEAFRLIPIAELTPISSEVPLDEKRIVVDLAKQWMYCYEGSDLILTTKIASGRALGDGSYWTPAGDFVTFRKRPSRHMVAGNRATGYDLPGVPWVCYITDNGVAFHGTYWHNDFGTPRSHGCINLASESAKWLYRWTKPVVPASEMESWVSYGTSVEIHG